MERTGSKLTNLGDSELALLATEQNQMAFVVLHSRYQAGVRHHLARYISQKEDIEDICMETFQKAFSQIGSFNPDYKFSTWLFRIARNAAFDHLSRTRREKDKFPTTSLSDESGDFGNLLYMDENPEDDIIHRQEYDKWLANIEKLKDSYRVIARMSLIDNYGYKEIAEELDLPLNTVKTRVRRAKDKLMKMMELSDDAMED